MPRPKSDIKPISVKLGERHRRLLACLAKRYDPPTRAEVVRQLIEKDAKAKKIKSVECE